MSVLRWILVLPGAVIAAGAARFLLVFLERFGMMTTGIPPESFIWNAVSQYTGGLAFGGVMAYAAAWIAPRYKLAAAITVTGLLLLLTGMGLMSILARRGYMDLIELAVTILAATAVCIAIHRGDIDFGTEGTQPQPAHEW